MSCSFQRVEKVAIRHFFEYYGFCLPLMLTGGKSREILDPYAEQAIKADSIFYASFMVMLFISGCSSAGMVPLLSMGFAASHTASTTSMPSVT